MGTLRADTITNGAGTGAPNFSNGLTFAGGATLKYSQFATSLGSIATARASFLTVVTSNPGTAMVQTSNDTTNGLLITISKSGIYSIAITAADNVNTTNFSVTKNTAGTVDAVSATAANKLIQLSTETYSSAGFPAGAWTGYLVATDTIAINVTLGATPISDNRGHFEITQLISFS